MTGKKKIAVIGGGIIGLATALKIQQKIKNSIVSVFEKESEIGKHQSGRNSGVLHCGLYYEPGSLKAKLAVSGIKQMTDFCKKYQIPHDICGKVVVATNSNESKLLEKLGERGHKNGLKGLKFLSKDELKKREPFVHSLKSLLVPDEGIVDYKMVMCKMEELILNRGGNIITNSEIKVVNNSNDSIVLKNHNVESSFDLLINCTGLYSDKNYKEFTGHKRPLQIVPFRGEYLMFKNQYNEIVNNLIYPVPDPEYPFLGIHFTRLISGERELGPDAVFAFKRDGYLNTDISISETIDSLTCIGLLKFISKNFKFSLDQLSSSIFLSIFIKKAQKMIPEIKSDMFIKGTAGVRAQAMDKSGNLIMDFRILREKNQIHVLNAPSPGATASLAIADYIIKDIN